LFSAQADTTAPPTLKPYQYQNDTATAVGLGWLRVRGKRPITDETIAEFIRSVNDTTD
jgi:hypothetical protein